MGFGSTIITVSLNYGSRASVTIAGSRSVPIRELLQPGLALYSPRAWTINITEDNPVRVVDVFVGELDLKALDFDGAEPEPTGRPGYHPGTLLKIYRRAFGVKLSSTRSAR